MSLAAALILSGTVFAAQPLLTLGEENAHFGDGGWLDALSPDGALAVTADSGTIRVFDTLTRDEISSYPAPLVLKDLHFLTPARLSGSDENGRWESWNTVDGGSRMVLRRFSKDPLIYPTVSRDGTFAATTEFPEIVVYDLRSGSVTARLDFKDRFDVNPVHYALSPDGKKLAGTDFSGHLALWDLETSRVAWSTKAFSAERVPVSQGAAGVHYSMPDIPGQIEFTPDGRWVATLGTRGLLIFDAKTGRLRSISSPPAPQDGPLVAHPDGKRFLAADRRGFVREVHLDGSVRRLPRIAQTHFTQLAISTDAARLVLLEAYGRLLVRDLHKGTAIGRAETRGLYHIAYTPDSKRLIMTWSDGWVEVRRMPEGGVVRRFRVCKLDEGDEYSSLNGVTLTPNGKRLLTVSKEFTGYWDVSSGRRLAALPIPKRETIRGANFFPDGKKFVSIGIRQLFVRDAETGAEDARFDVPQFVSDIEVSPDGHIIATGLGNGQLYAVEYPSLRPIFTAPPEGRSYSYVDGLAFTPGGRLLYARRDGDGLLFRISIPSGKVLSREDIGRDDVFWPLGDGRRLLRQSAEDGRIRLSVERPGDESVLALDEPDEIGRVAVVAPDGSAAVTFGRDGRLRVWPLP